MGRTKVGYKSTVTNYLSQRLDVMFVWYDWTLQVLNRKPQGYDLSFMLYGGIRARIGDPVERMAIQEVRLKASEYGASMPIDKRTRRKCRAYMGGVTAAQSTG